MQVMTRVHTEKFEGLGGRLATFDPVSNLRVGVKVLQDCIAKAGSVSGGLRLYVGAGPQGDDGGYAGKVMAEQQRLKQVAAGQSVPTWVAPPAAAGPSPSVPANVAPAAPAATLPAAAAASAAPAHRAEIIKPGSAGEKIASAQLERN